MIDNPTPIAIRTEALTKVFHGRAIEVRAVDGIDLEVHTGEVFGLLGPNGAGKTTTVGMLTTRVIPTKGQAFVGDIDVVRDPTTAKQLIGVVPQVNTLDRSLNVWENLYFHGRYFGMGARGARRAADELLQRFQLADRAKADTITLSGGMAQRLMVARAVMHRPAVLFLDEPTAGLDPQSRLALWNVVNELRAAGQTVLLTTHYMEEADELCDRVAVMDHGRILALGSPKELKEALGSDTAIRITAEGDLDALAERLRARPMVSGASAVDGVVTVFVRGSSGEALARIAAEAQAVGVEIHDVAITQPTLESVFIGLTGKDLRE